MEFAFGKTKVQLPPNVAAKVKGKSLHLDPDFEQLTYGDWRTKGERLGQLIEGDFIAFYASLEPIDTKRPLVYALIGFYWVKGIVTGSDVRDIPKGQWDKNAHTRFEFNENDKNVIVRAEPNGSGRFTKAIPIGEPRPRGSNYYVDPNILIKWGGLDVRNGWIQRSGITPWLCDPEKFLIWFDEKKPKLVRSNGWTLTQNSHKGKSEQKGSSVTN